MTELSAHSVYHHNLHGLHAIVCLFHTFDDSVYKIFAPHILHFSRLENGNYKKSAVNQLCYQNVKVY